MYSPHLIVVVVGFVDTLVEVNETDGQATLNVSISHPLPIPGVPGLQLMFSLSVDSMDDSAGRDGISQSCELSTLIYGFSLIKKLVRWLETSLVFISVLLLYFPCYSIILSCLHSAAESYTWR